MKTVLAHNEMKRGDAVLFQYKYLLTYSGVGDELLKSGTFFAYGKRRNDEEGVTSWFNKKYHNELIKVEMVG
jgi:hypothetical protein